MILTEVNCPSAGLNCATDTDLGLPAMIWNGKSMLWVLVLIPLNS